MMSEQESSNSLNEECKVVGEDVGDDGVSDAADI